MAVVPIARHTGACLRLAAALLGLLWAGEACPVEAAFSPPTMWARSVDGRSTYQEWDKFVAPAGPNPPNSPNVPLGASVDAAPFNPNGVADVVESSGASFITSGGNIYSPTAVTDFDVSVPNFGAAATWTTVLVQLRTQGSLLDVSAVRVTGGGGPYAAVDSALLFSQALGGFGGVLEDRWFEFHLPGNAGAYLVEFHAAESSMSLDKLAIDTVWTSAATPIDEPNPVPEPGAIALLAGGTLAALAWRLGARRRR